VIALALIAAAIAAVFLIRNPLRTLWALAIGGAAVLVLAELASVRPAMLIGAIVALGIAAGGRRRREPLAIVEPVPDTPMARAWQRLAQAGGFWSRNRIVVLKARCEAVAASTAECDPFSEAGELRLKLDRYIPELIDNMLDERQRAPAVQRRAKLAELLTELERFVGRLEAADPAGKLRADRREALRRHLGSGGDE
jgi:hypothetical protein